VGRILGAKMTKRHILKNEIQNPASSDNFSLPNSANPESIHHLDYEMYVRPQVAKLLKAFNLDKIYHEGEGNWLFSEIGKKNNLKYLDVTGGYGANSLGHKNPYVQEIMIQQILHGAPSHLQGSIRKGASELGKKISHLLEKETQKGHWISHFSNSGTESVETAIKHCLLKYQMKLSHIHIDLTESYNSSNKYIYEDHEEVQLNEKFIQLKNFLLDKFSGMTNLNSIMEKIEKSTDLSSLFEIIKNYNEQILLQSQIIVSIEGGFHGKTIGSLSATTSSSYWEPFGLKRNPTDSYSSVVLDKILSVDEFENKKGKILNLLNSLEIKYIYIDLYNKIDPIKFLSLSPVAAIIVEPLQGEAGIYEINSQYLRFLRNFTSNNHIPLISDEIQAGLYRTGTLASLSSSNIHADIYCFSKGLGGGHVKIGITSIHKDEYIEDFGRLHTSTFAEDDISSNVALKVLQLIDVHQNKIKQTLQLAHFFKNELMNLKSIFPEIIKDIRGKGLMLAIEFQNDLSDSCHEFKFFSNSNMLGYLFSGTLLYQENIRIAPTLSSPYTLRIEPSLYTTQSEFKKIYKSLKNLTVAIKNFDSHYLFEHLFPHHKISPVNMTSPETYKVKNPLIPTVCFLSHAIEISDIKKVLKSLEFIPDNLILNKLNVSCDIVEFGVTYSCLLKDQFDNEINFLLVSLPLPSETIVKCFRGKQRHLISGKIQSGVDLSYALGAKVVGLGQFTSIVTKNGLLINAPSDLNITTGNPYTVALTIESALTSAISKDINLSESTVTLIGAAGNIISVSAILISESVRKINLIHHSPIEKDSKFLHVTFDIIMEIKKSDSKSPCVQGIKKCLASFPLDNVLDTINFLNHYKVSEFITANHTLNSLMDSQIIITGTNSTKSLLNSTDIPQNCLVVDLGVPRNISEELISGRPDITYILGGIAQLPNKSTGSLEENDLRPQGIHADFFPLNCGEVFACMAETITLGFINSYYPHLKNENDRPFRHIGSISKSVVKKTEKFAEAVGIKLGRTKKSHSF
jgi:acetylornithine/succinyldiaminopimelate/putrescine aminotransferase/predicted amino acid dehydrogenase